MMRNTFPERAIMTRKPGLMRRLAPWLAIAGLIVIADQISKLIVERTFVFAERVPVTSFFDLTLLYNKGAAFSFLASAAGWQRWFFIGIGCAAALFIVFMLARHGNQRLFALALALILGGAVGNVIDRIIHGHVIDFLLFYWNGWYWPAFNIADSCIVAGAITLVLDEILRVRRTKSV